MARRNRRGRAVHGVLLLDKPPGGSSNHALQRVKRLFGASKAGHTGSLDPLATGMLPICLGEATKLAAWLIDADKGYETTLRLGVTTDSADADGEVIERRPVPPGLDRAGFEDACRAFEGEQLQVPPMVSAIKVDGQRLYKLAREGITVERAPRAVTIHRLEVLAFDGDSARLAVRCSKGTYIRSLVTDIGERLGCGAHVTSLRRTFVAPFGPDDGEGDPGGEPDGARPDAPRGELAMVTLDELERLAGESGVAYETGGADDARPPGERWQVLDRLLLPPDAGLGHLPELMLSETELLRFRRGQAARLDPLVDPSRGTRGRSGEGGGEASERSGADGPAGAHGEPAIEARERAPWRVREPSGRLAGLGRVSADGGSVAPFRVLQWD